MTFHAVLGIIAGVLAFGVNPLYVIDIVRGKTKPSRVTWWVLALLNGLLVFSYFSSGARDTIWIRSRTPSVSPSSPCSPLSMAKGDGKSSI